MQNNKKRISVLLTFADRFLGEPSAEAILRLYEKEDVGLNLYLHGIFENFSALLMKQQHLNQNCKIIPIKSTTPNDIVKEIGPEGVDILINNDPYPAKKNEFSNINEHDLRDTFENLTMFPFKLTSQLIKKMQERKQGKIIFITSATADVGLANYTPYVMARAATNAMMLSLAKEVGKDNILVNAVAPNFIESEAYFPKKLISNPDILAKITSPIPLKRLGKPNEAGELVAFLASPNSSYIHGQIIRIAGGW